jgi:hypothetical protein
MILITATVVMITDTVKDQDTMGGMMTIAGGILVAVDADTVEAEAEAEVLLGGVKNLHEGRTVLKEEQK